MVWSSSVSLPIAATEYNHWMSAFLDHLNGTTMRHELSGCSVTQGGHLSFMTLLPLMVRPVIEHYFLLTSQQDLADWNISVKSSQRNSCYHQPQPIERKILPDTCQTRVQVRELMTRELNQTCTNARTCWSTTATSLK